MVAGVGAGQTHPWPAATYRSLGLLEVADIVDEAAAKQAAIDAAAKQAAIDAAVKQAAIDAAAKQEAIDAAAKQAAAAKLLNEVHYHALPLPSGSLPPSLR